MNDAHDNAQTDHEMLNVAKRFVRGESLVDTDSAEPPCTLYLRNLPYDTAQIIKRRSRARGMTMSQYVHALVRMHTVLLRDATTDDGSLSQLLNMFGLGKVKD